MKATANKKELRRYFLTQRRSLTKQERQTKSMALLELFLQQPEYRQAQQVMAYAAMADEVQTASLLSRILADGKQLYLPYITEAKQGLMEAARVVDLAQLQPDCYGIMAPSAQAVVAVEQQLDLVIIPGVAFTEQLQRLGMGGGFYDRFLARLTRAVKFGIFFEVQCAPTLPLEKYDKRLDCICTEQRVLR